MHAWISANVCVWSSVFPDTVSKPVPTGWGMNQWISPTEECPNTLPPSSEAITKPVTRTVVDESESFFSAFLTSGDLQTVKKTSVVSVAPTKSYRRVQEKADKETKPSGKDDVDSSMLSHPDSERLGSMGPEENMSAEVRPQEQVDPPATVTQQTSPAGVQQPEPVPPAPLTAQEQIAEPESSERKAESEDTRLTLEVTQVDAPLPVAAGSGSVDNVVGPGAPEPKSPVKTLPIPPKEIVLDSKEPKVEDRQSDTPSPPVSAFSSGTSTTSDIEVLDHESVISESSASSKQDSAEVKAGLHLMQGSFQLLSASACGDFPRLDDYPKLTESCGSSSDAFERIDSFSVQSLDSRSVSEVNSDDEIPGNHTLASVTAGPTPAPLALPAPPTTQEQEELELADSVKDQTLEENEMEESGRSATPVNCDQPEDLQEAEQNADSSLTLSSLRTEPDEALSSPITEEQKGASTCQLLELQKVRLC